MIYKAFHRKGVVRGMSALLGETVWYQVQFEDFSYVWCKCGEIEFLETFLKG